MAEGKRPFRVGDPCHVKGWLKGKDVNGRVICINRLNPYGHCIVVLFTYDDGFEHVETWMKDGGRYVNHHKPESRRFILEFGRAPK